MPTVYKEVEVDIDLDDFDDDDIIDEMERRGLDVSDAGAASELIEKIWLKRRQGQDFTHELDRLIYATIGKVV
jgi:hypothetical protein